MKVFDFGQNPRVLIEYGDQVESALLYSEEGKELVDSLSLKQSVFFKTMYSHHWCGVRVIQFPNDLLALQEIFFEVRPTLVIEMGVAHGGSLIFSASLLSILGIDDYRVLGIDIDIRSENRAIIERHFFSPKIELFEGSSTSKEAVEFVRSKIKSSDRVLIILDSCHTRDHVFRELEIYSEFVSKDSYLIAMDGALGFIGDVPGQSKRDYEDNPYAAIRLFLEQRTDFQVVGHFDRLGTTSSPLGALKKV
jgi:cephalosporin hydroxylase